MNKERMIGFMMLALLIVITIVYFVFSSEVKNLEAENERLREAIVEQEKNLLLQYLHQINQKQKVMK